METAIGAVALDRTAQPEPASPLPIIIVRAEMPASMLSAYECGLYDEEPIFVSDEVILWGVSMSDVDDVLEDAANTMGWR
jgi:hypothetical protein